MLLCSIFMITVSVCRRAMSLLLPILHVSYYLIIPCTESQGWLFIPKVKQRAWSRLLSDTSALTTPRRACENCGVVGATIKYILLLECIHGVDNPFCRPIWCHLLLIQYSKYVLISICGRCWNYPPYFNFLCFDMLTRDFFRLGFYV